MSYTTKNKIGEVSPFIFIALVATIAFSFIFNYEHNKHWDLMVPEKMNELVYNHIDQARHLGFYHAKDVSLNTINGHRDKFLLLDMFKKDNRAYLNVALRESLFARPVSNIKLVAAELHVGDKTHQLPAARSRIIEGGDTVFGYFEISPSLLTAAITAPDSYLLIKTNRGEIRDEIASKCPEFRAHHWHPSYGHDHSEYNGHDNQHIHDYHTSARAFGKRFKGDEIENLCSQIKALLKYHVNPSQSA